MLGAPSTLGGGGAAYAAWLGGLDAPVYTLYYYDHCPFGHRVHLLLHRFGIQYRKVIFGYGDDGEGPRVLTGLKQCPVLQGPGVPCGEGEGCMLDSLKICSFLIAKHGLSVSHATGRADVDEFIAGLREASDLLCVKRNPEMPVKDWADPRDVSYYFWKKRTHGQEPQCDAVEKQLKRKVNEKLLELPPLLRGANCLNEWGWGVDDLLLLPWLRRLTMIKGVEYPPPVAAYMEANEDELCDYRPHAF